MARAVHVAAEVDCLVSLAAAARDLGWVRPTLTRDDVLDIRQGASLWPLHAWILKNSIMEQTIQFDTWNRIPCQTMGQCLAHMLETTDYFSQSALFSGKLYGLHGHMASIIHENMWYAIQTALSACAQGAMR